MVKSASPDAISSSIPDARIMGRATPSATHNPIAIKIIATIMFITTNCIDVLFIGVKISLVGIEIMTYQFKEGINLAAKN